MRCARAALLAVALAAPGALATGEAVPIDRAVVRYFARETGGVASPRFVTARELAFEARLRALSAGEPAVRGGAPRERHVRAALELHVTETVLASLPVAPAPTEPEIERRTTEAHAALAERVGGESALVAAAQAEGLGEAEVLRLARRRARASLYLDRMVAPLLEPSEAELRLVHRTERTPYAGQAFEAVRPALARWLVSTRVAEAIDAYHEALRARVTVTVLR
ncbi:MAG: hypothetical protein FJ104_14075 [Deltaproteobacteria bacterium]|nr:hypothetical protein [Deltaproteobacteria bacterium]